MLKKRCLGNQKGFTLIEIIAVLLLLGIMAAVAVPKFFDMQEETEKQTLKIALNDMKSRCLLQYTKSVMANDGTADVTEQADFESIGFTHGSTANILDAYRDYLGTWAYPTVTTITYVTNYGGTTYTFTHVDPATAADPATITLTP
ncbi:MAG: type II secretion system GspH family protein [Desulfobacula sp.]|nr:type II secretion system GspH family protein [Desulfobacula sp.]